MTLADVVVRRVSWRVERGFESAAGRWLTRHACVVALRDVDGMEGVGEAAPLPGLSADDVERCEAALRRTLRRGTAIAVDAGAIGDALHTLAIGLQDAPAAIFAAETAWLDLVARRRGEPLARVLCDVAKTVAAPAARVGVAAVLDGEPGSWSDEARRATERGIRTLKVKIGKLDWKVEHAALCVLRKRMASDGELRLDANGAWAGLSAGSVAQRLASLREVAPSFVEEPVPIARADSAMLDELAASGVRIAADESMRPPATDDAIDGWLARGACSALVIKPTVVGGLLRSVALARIAKMHGATVVVSHTLEGPIGYAACCELALALGGDDATGLDRHPLLAPWPADATPHFTACAIAGTDRAGLEDVRHEASAA